MIIGDNYVCSDNEGKSFIKGFSVTNISVRRKANVISAPIESGQESFDNKILLPLEVVVTGSVSAEDDDGAESILAEMYASREFKFYSVMEEDVLHNNLILKEMPYDRGTKAPDLRIYNLLFVEAMLIQENKYTPANPQNRDTVKSGRIVSGRAIDRALLM